MAVQTWSYVGWRRESGTTAQRTMLIQHIEEVEQYLADWRDKGAQNLTGTRFELSEYLKGLDKKLEKYDEALGSTVKKTVPMFVQGKPVRRWL